MLTIPRRKGESIVIGEDIILTVVEIRDGTLRLRIECPNGTEVCSKDAEDVIVGREIVDGPEAGFPSFLLH